jgi:hypothetical protein
MHASGVNDIACILKNGKFLGEFNFIFEKALPLNQGPGWMFH